MPFGPNVLYVGGNVVSGASTLTSVDISTRSWRTVYAQISTMSTQAAIDVYGSMDNSTFRPVFSPVQTATTCWVYQTMAIGSQVGTGGGIAPIFTGGCQYLQFRCSAVVSGGVSIAVICAD